MDISNTWDMAGQCTFQTHETWKRKPWVLKNRFVMKKIRERRRVFEVTEKKKKMFSLSLSLRLMDLEKGHSTGQMDKTMTNRGIMKICL